ALVEREVPRDVRVELGFEVGAQVLELAVDGSGLGDGAPVDEDGAALGRVAVVEGAHVAWVCTKVIDLERGDDRARGHEGEDHDEHDRADTLDFGDHGFTTTCGPVRIVSESRSSSTAMIQLATSD